MSDEKPSRSSKSRASLLASDKTLVIDYKTPQLLKAFLTDRGKVVPARISGVSAKQQRQITKAVKRARMLPLLPYTVAGRAGRTAHHARTHPPQGRPDPRQGRRRRQGPPRLRPQLPDPPRPGPGGHPRQHRPARAPEAADRRRAGEAGR